MYFILNNSWSEILESKVKFAF